MSNFGDCTYDRYLLKLHPKLKTHSWDPNAAPPSLCQRLNVQSYGEKTNKSKFEWVLAMHYPKILTLPKNTIKLQFRAARFPRSDFRNPGQNRGGSHYLAYRWYSHLRNLYSKDSPGYFESSATHATRKLIPNRNWKLRSFLCFFFFRKWGKEWRCLKTSTAISDGRIFQNRQISRERSLQEKAVVSLGTNSANT